MIKDYKDLSAHPFVITNQLPFMFDFIESVLKFTNKYAVDSLPNIQSLCNELYDTHNITFKEDIMEELKGVINNG